MEETRRFPVVWVSLLLALVVAIGILQRTRGDARSDPARTSEATVPNSVPPSPLPPLPEGDAAASAGAGNRPDTPAKSTPAEPSADPPAPPDMRVRTVKQGATPECAAVTGWVKVTVAARDQRVIAVFQKLKVTIWRVNGRDLQLVEAAADLPTETGEFGIRNLPDGDYLIEFVSEDDGNVVRAKREFRVAGYTADLGEIDLTVYSGIRAKVVDVAGRPIEQADVVVVRPEENPEQARRLNANQDGWVTYFDLEPDLVHQVVVLGLPTRLERTVRTPGRSLEATDVVFETSLRTVPTTIAFYVDGEFTRFEALAGLQSDTRLKKSPTRDGIVSTWLLPGTYRFWTEDREGTLLVDDRDRVQAKVHLYAKAGLGEEGGGRGSGGR